LEEIEIIRRKNPIQEEEDFFSPEKEEAELHLAVVEPGGEDGAFEKLLH
jgi:hypothetical protein